MADLLRFEVPEKLLIEQLSLVEKAGFTNTCIVTDAPEFGCTWITAQKTCAVVLIEG